MIKNFILTMLFLILSGCATISDKLPDKVSDKMKDCTNKKTTLNEIFCKK